MFLISSQSALKLIRPEQTTSSINCFVTGCLLELCEGRRYLISNLKFRIPVLTVQLHAGKGSVPRLVSKLGRVLMDQDENRLE